MQSFRESKSSDKGMTLKKLAPHTRDLQLNKPKAFTEHMLRISQHDADRIQYIVKSRFKTSVDTCTINTLTNVGSENRDQSEIISK